MIRRPPRSPLFPSPPLFRSRPRGVAAAALPEDVRVDDLPAGPACSAGGRPWVIRSEEHTSELQSLAYLVCRLLLEKKKNIALLTDYSVHCVMIVSSTHPCNV